MFCSFGIVALLTGVMSESMSENNEARKQQIRQEHESLRDNLASECQRLFNQLHDLDANGEASVKSVTTLAKPIWEMLAKIGAEMTHADVNRVIEFMDVNGTGLIHVSEFRQSP
jgi:Ca2+-binding EF-hand superfamily protein